MVAPKSFYTKQKKMWKSWSHRKQHAYVKAHPRSVFPKRYGFNKK